MEHLPPWLRNLPLPARPPGREPPPAGDAAEADIPEWLRELRSDVADQPAAPDSAVPEWLRPSDTPAEPPTAREAPTGATAWLSSLGAGQPPAGPPAPAEPPAAPPAPGAEQGDETTTTSRVKLPEGATDWLRSIGHDPDALSEPISGPLSEALDEEGGVPEWLRDLTADEVAAGLAADSAAPPEPAEPFAEAESPDWLRDIIAADAELQARRPEPAAAPEPDNVDVPAWLREAAEPPAAGAAAEEVPAWLREAAEPPAEVPPLATEPAEAAAPAGGEEMPGWLQEAFAEREVLPDEPRVPAGDVPPWLIEHPPPPVPPAPSSDLPPWLSAEAPEASGTPPAAGGEPGLPSWLQGLPEEPLAAVPPPVEQQAPPPARRPAADEGDSSGFLKGAELPSWLRVPEPEVPEATVEGEQLDWLRRLGGSEAEERELAAPVAAVALRQRAGVSRTPEQLEAVRLLQQLAEAPYPAPAAPSVPTRRTRLERIGLDRILYGLLALALLIALLVPQLTAPFQGPAPSAAGATELGALLDSLGPEDVVLVAYEWAAQRSSELRPLEAAVTRRLIANQTKLILVSTDLQGTLLSFDLIEPLRAAGYNNENGVPFGGRDYVLLGYRPGGELALRRIAQDLRGELTSDFDGQDASQGLVANNPDGTPRISGIQDLKLILVLADQPQDVQVWMEQVHRQVRDQVPIAFLLPQEAQPLAQPYLRLPNVYALAGQRGALALLASDVTADQATLARSTGQLGFAVIVFVALLLIGAIVSLLTRGSGAGGGEA
ncbi:MAG: hypothetical protein HXY37_10295 [Chloroflexi bacterium]|nr:hypothetical protein [Chloroflexota bacterium]